MITNHSTCGNQSSGAAFTTARRFLFLSGCLALWMMLPALSQADVPLANGSNVLVVANAAWNGLAGETPDVSERVARYYMLRRGVPEDHLLLVNVESTPSYATFHQKVVTPLAKKLESLRGADGNDPILYILCCYGMPLNVSLNLPLKQREYPEQERKTVYNSDGSVKLQEEHTYAWPRSADSFLCYPQWLAAQSPTNTLDSNRNAFGGLYHTMSSAPPLTHPYYGLSVQAQDAVATQELQIGYATSRQKEAPISFAEARSRNPNKFAYYLVCRLDAPNAQVARSLVDKAVYAERYLKNPGDHAPISYSTECVFDMGEQEITCLQVKDCVEWFSGRAAGSPFRNKPWPMIVDTATGPGQEIGVANTNGVLYRPNDPKFVGRSFPMTNVVWYYGHYTTYGRYQDVYQWAVGAIGIHMDSGACADLHTREWDAFRNMAEPPDEKRSGFVPHALMRNMTASSGPVHEPFEDGIIAGNFLFRALSLGRNFADACYTATRDIWWKSLFVGDPLYTPFASEKQLDRDAPRILTALIEKKHGEERWLCVTTDKPCQFAVSANGRDIRPFSCWGDEWANRDWFFACELYFKIPDQATNAICIIRAKSPAGLVTTAEAKPVPDAEIAAWKATRGLQ